MKKFFVASVIAFATVAGAAVGSPAFAGTGIAAEPRPIAVGSATAVTPTTGIAGRITTAAAPLNLAEARVSYRKKGDTVTVTRKGQTVATITLASAKYAATSATVKFTVDAKRPLKIDPQMFIMWDARSGENSPTATAPVTMKTGRHTLTLTFRGLHGRGQAVGWAPSNGEAVWAR